MKKQMVKKSVMSLFMVGLILMTFFIPLISPTKSYNKNLGYSVVIKPLKGESSNSQSQNQSSVNLIEEEVEYTTETNSVVYPRLPIFITTTFSSPNLFFNQHFIEVSGPPPWA